MSVIKFLTIRIFRNVHIFKIYRMISFCNLFMERLSYVHHYDILAEAYPQDILISEPVLKPTNREGSGRNGIWHKNALGCKAGLTLTLICVAAAGLLVVIQ